MTAYNVACYTIVLALAAIGIYYTRGRCSGNTGLGSRSLPPGPPGFPWVGNIGINISAPWLTYSNWAKTYGNLVYSRLLGRDIIIINSEEVAQELLGNRSTIYSDRPYLITNELCGIGFNSVLLPYGARWRLHRRFLHQTFRADAVARFALLQDHKSFQLLRGLLHTPEQFKEHVFEYTASLILNSVYGYDPGLQHDELVQTAAKVLEVVKDTVAPAVAIFVGTFPSLLNLPSWLPGMAFKTRMATARKLMQRYIEQPFTYSQQNLKLPGIHKAGPCMVHDALRAVKEREIPDESWMESLKAAAATTFLAASDTSDSVLMSFFLMMVIHPEIQKKAQAQVDAVVGKKRLPTIDDRPSLPYVDAILREILRHSHPAPLSVPHATVRDDVYAGYYIPKGAIITVNIWSITHNELKYPEPYAFRPERFLNDDGTLKPDDIENIVFGFGRRICPGRHFANTSLWSVIAKVLTVFTVLKPLDEDGMEIPVEPKFTGVGARHPVPFRCRIVPRIEGMDEAKLEEFLLSARS